MPEDKLYEEANEDLSDQILDLATGAAATGLAAVSFYRAGGIRGLSRILEDYSHSGLKQEIDHLTGQSYDHINYRVLKKSFSNIHRELKDFKKTDYDRTIRIGDSPDSLAGYLGQIEKLKTGRRHIEKDLLHQREVTDKLVLYADERLKKAIENIGDMNGQLEKQRRELQQMESFVRDISKNATSQDYMTSFGAKQKIRKYDSTGRFAGVYKDVIQKAIELNNALIEKKTKPSLDHISAETKIVEEALKMDNLVRAAGNKSASSKIKDKLLGDKKVTVGYVLDHPDKFNDATGKYIRSEGAVTEKSTIDILREIEEKMDESNKKLFRSLAIDPHLRMNSKGEVYSLRRFDDLKRSVVRAAASTMPGKIFKLRDLDMSATIPKIIEFTKGSINPVLAALEEDNKTKRIRSNYYYLAGKTYRYNEKDNKLEEIKEMRDATIMSSRFGAGANLYTDIMGLNAERVREKGSLERLFDVNASVETGELESLKSFLTGRRDGNYIRNILKDFQEGNITDTHEQYKKLVELNEYINKRIRGLSDSQLDSLQSEVSYIADKYNYDVSEANTLYDILKTNDPLELLDRAMGLAKTNDKFRSMSLNTLLNKVVKDQAEFKNSIEKAADITGAWENDAVVGLDYEQQLRKELSKEYLLSIRDSFGSKDDYTFIKRLIDRTKMTRTESERAKEFSYYTLLNYTTDNLLTGSANRLIDFAAEDGTMITESDVRSRVGHAVSLLSGRIMTEGGQDASKTLKSIIEDSSLPSMLHAAGRDSSEDFRSQYIDSNFVMIHRNAALDIIGSINKSIQTNSISPIKDNVLDIWKQLTAGANDASNVSTLTLFPYFFLRRLGADDMPQFLQFSNSALSSTGALAKTIAKRLLPLAIGETYLEWADDTVGAITGTRPSAGFINGLDYMDIGARKMLDISGIGGILNNESYVNPIMQYWTGKDGYYNADQERDYLANGYEPVRRGRYWSFGSVNEFRGSNIEYFQPNLTRRLNSDYYNKSLYNGYWDKWGHSLLPTPTAPFSPLVYIMDPYYLEEEHKEDRPYPVSGPMFEQNTPWGIVLNPTIGELIKPVVRMNEDRLTDDGQDVKAIIYGINKHIRDTASGDHAYAMVFDREQITAGEYTAYSNPSLGQYNIRVGKTRGEQMRQDQIDALGGPMELERRTYLYSGANGYGNGSTDGIGSSVSGGIGVSGLSGSGSSPLDLLGQTNRQIYVAASRNENRGGIITTDAIRYSKLDDILNSDDMMDLIQAGQGGDLVSEMATSFRLISGIYGYGANRAFGFGESDGRQIANSSDIDSFTRSFWDESLGGIGGGAAEIGRRFIPEYRRNIRVNPLLNTMPDWLPEKYRTGDPYASIPKGEARLPGKGYEALNNLHPDVYGIYGSYDRFKILADVAPNSVEYKVWKKIAQGTVTDNALKQDMQKITQRVEEQQKAHDFYPYQILGNNVEYQDATISEVNNDGTFRIKGSSDLYTMAGIDFNIKHTNPNDYEAKSANQLAGKEIMEQYLAPGMSVTLAVDSNQYHKNNPDAVNSVNAAVYVDGESIAQTILEEHPDAVQRKIKNRNAADVYAMTNTAERFVGGIAEFVAHLDVPFFHDKFLRVRDPLESYNAEQIYGTPYQTWSDIWGTYIVPAFERSISNPYAVIGGTAEYLALNAIKERQGIGIIGKKALSLTSVLFDRGAFMGSMIAKTIMPGSGRSFELGGKVGLALSLAGNLYTSTQTSTVASMASYAQVGWLAADFLDEGKERFAKELQGSIKKFFRDDASFKYRTKGALIGAGIGLLASGVFGTPLESNDRGKWIPDRIKQKWDTEDYFDRLTYIKYMGLYHKAARMAEDEEGIDMEKIFNDYDEWSKKRQEIMSESDVNNTEFFHVLKQDILRDVNRLKTDLFGDDNPQNHRFEYSNGFSINDLPGVRNGVFHSDEVSEEDRLFTLNALVTMGIRYNKQGTNRTQDDRDMTQLTDFERVYGTKIPEYYQVHHIVEFAQNGPDDPSNMIALSPDDHLYITEQQHKLAEGDFEAAQIGARTAMRLGEYGRAALLYKKAAESTMYGLRADARWTDVVKALPRYERDYFTEFMKERAPDKQEEILKTVSPFMRRALKQVWGMDYEDEKGPDNEEYFQNHNLPNFLWEGWNPDSDLNKIKAKTIKNEGMLFSDFGIYESTYRDQQVINAPNLSPKGGDDPITVQTNLTAALNGLGLAGVEVSVEPKSTKGIQSVINLTKVTQYKMSEAIDNLF